MEEPLALLFRQWGPESLAFGFLALVLWMLFTGRLVTRREHENALKDRDFWREAHETSEGTRRIMAQQLDRALIGSDVATQAIEALKKAADAE